MLYRVAVVVAIVSLIAVSGYLLPGTGFGRVASAGTPFSIPSQFVQDWARVAPTCTADNAHPSFTIAGLNAEGTGITGTTNITKFANNTGVNTTTDVPSTSLSTGQIIGMGVAEPISSSEIVGVGAALGSQYGITEGVPLVILPNATTKGSVGYYYNAPGTANLGLGGLSQGSPYVFAITHKAGTWWTFTYASPGGTAYPIVGNQSWENGTLNLGVSKIPGTACEFGGLLGPSFIVLSYGSGSAVPQFPKTSVPYAIGVTTSSGKYVPLSANILPQFNATLGTMGIQAHDQNAAIGYNSLVVGSTSAGVAYPGAYLPAWGNYKEIILNTSSVSPVFASLAYNATQQFNATALGVTGATVLGAHYHWGFTPSTLGALSGTSGASVNFTAAGITVSGKVWVNVTYNCSAINSTANVTVTKTGGPSINSFTVVPPVITVGENTTFNVTHGPWSRPISYAYAGLPTGCTGGNVTSFTCAPTASGNYSVTVYLNDTAGHSSSATAPLTVDKDLTVVSFTSTPSVLTENTTTTFKVVASGGIPLLTYNFSGMPAGCGAGIEPSVFSCRPTNYGSFNVSVNVTDSAGHYATRTLSLKVNTPLSVSGVTASPSAVNVGQTTYINVTVIGGTAPYGFVYHNLPQGCTSSNLSKIQCTPGINGTFLVTANVTDASGANASGSTLLIVNLPPVPVISSFSASPAAVNVSQSTVFTVVALGGTPPLSYTYTGLPSGCTSQDTGSLACTPTQAGNYTVTAKVSDSAGHSAIPKSTTLTVIQPSGGSAPVIASFTISPSPVPLGSRITVTVSATGGTGTLSYAYVGLPTGCLSTDVTSFTCTPTSVGNYTVTVYVNDSAKHSVTQTTSVSVLSSSGTTPNNSTASGSGFFSTWVILAIVAVVVVAIVAGVLLMRRKKTSGPSTMPSQNAPSQEPTGRDFTGYPPQQPPYTPPPQ